MSGSTGTPVVTQSQSKDPWSGAQGYLSQMYGTAQAMQQSGTGYQPYTGATVAPLTPELSAGLYGQMGIAQNQLLNPAGPVAAVNLAEDVNQQLIAARGYDPAMQAGLGTVGQAGAQFQNLYNQNIGQTNPYLLQAIEDANRRGIEKVQSAMSGAGRYGSAQMQDVMARAQAEVADPTLAQDYAQRMQIAQAASQGLGTVGQAQAQIGNMAGANLRAFEGMIPGLAQAQYLPYQMQAAAGQVLQDRAQQELQGNIALYNAQQAWPWQQLERESAILAGAGQLGGTTVTTQTPMQAPLSQRLLGGALVGGGLGSTIGGPFGAAGGAGLGALTGAFL